jgi:hypothetical protein
MVFDRVIDAINADPRVRFVLHTGDIKAGSERCDDSLLQRRFDQIQRFAKPVVYTPGDNEWTDCHRTNNGGYLPTERLSTLRSLFFPQPGVTIGSRPARLATQASVPGFGTFVENTLWSFGGATMGALHVVGSNNGYAPWNQIDAGDSYETPRADRVLQDVARQVLVARQFGQARRPWPRRCRRPPSGRRGWARRSSPRRAGAPSPWPGGARRCSRCARSRRRRSAPGGAWPRA